MSRAQLKEYLLDRLKNATTIPALLGPITSGNFRFFSSWPQTQPTLSNGEPDEGFCIYDVDDDTRVDPRTIFEVAGVRFDILTTRATLADDVIDQLDTLWHWRIPQQKAVTIGERILLLSKRVKTIGVYNTDVKLYQRTARYEWTLVKEVAEL